MNPIDLQFLLGLPASISSLDGARKTSYPPYNIIKTYDDEWVVEVATAGFSRDELKVTLEENALVLRGQRKATPEHAWEVIHGGLAKRDFAIQWRLAARLRVEKCTYTDGILKVVLKKVLEDSSTSIAIE